MPVKVKLGKNVVTVTAKCDVCLSEYKAKGQVEEDALDELLTKGWWVHGKRTLCKLCGNTQYSA